MLVLSNRYSKTRLLGKCCQLHRAPEAIKWNGAQRLAYKIEEAMEMSANQDALREILREIEMSQYQYIAIALLNCFLDSSIRENPNRPKNPEKE